MPLLDILLPESLGNGLARLAGCAAQVAFPRRNPFGAERRARGWYWSLRLGARGLRVDRNVQLEYYRSIQLGANVTLFAGVQIVSGPEAVVRVGDNTHIGRGTIVSGLGGVEIGAGCAISSQVSIYSVSNQFRHAPESPILENPVVHGKVTIGDDVWIGAGAVILPGVVIEDHAVIGAGAVVNRDVPKWHIAVGVPARLLGDRRQRAAPSRKAG